MAFHRKAFYIQRKVVQWKRHSNFLLVNRSSIWFYSDFELKRLEEMNLWIDSDDESQTLSLFAHPSSRWIKRCSPISRLQDLEILEFRFSGSGRNLVWAPDSASSFAGARQGVQNLGTAFTSSRERQNRITACDSQRRRVSPFICILECCDDLGKKSERNPVIENAVRRIFSQNETAWKFLKMFEFGKV